MNQKKGSLPFSSWRTNILSYWIATYLYLRILKKWDTRGYVELNLATVVLDAGLHGPPTNHDGYTMIKGSKYPCGFIAEELRKVSL